jgi:hypothetical protein
MENQTTISTETNFEIGFKMQKEGYGISDSFGSALATGKDNIPTDADIEEWTKGYNAAKTLTNMKGQLVSSENTYTEEEVRRAISDAYYMGSMGEPIDEQDANNIIQYAKHK